MKNIFRKEHPLKSIYEQIQRDLQRSADQLMVTQVSHVCVLLSKNHILILLQFQSKLTTANNDESSASSLAEHMLRQLRNFASARCDMVEFFDRLSNLGSLSHHNSCSNA